MSASQGKSIEFKFVAQRLSLRNRAGGKLLTEHERGMRFIRRQPATAIFAVEVLAGTAATRPRLP